MHSDGEKNLLSMRKTSQHFARKLQLTQKMTLLDWFEKTMPDDFDCDEEMIDDSGQDSDDEIDSGDGSRKTRKFCKHESHSEIEAEFQKGRVISAVKLKDREGEVWVVIGKWRREVTCMRI